ncbi:PDR/VanB family oxidoreductase [Actinophytocola sp.]|uniref:PDR/VanB family oxidoreductase n=1 Tax=Actinophytocola sp. TaxID=1872138 RepID=UPI002ED4D2B7
MADTASQLRVTAKRRVAGGVVSLDLAHPNGGRLPDWTPGAHIDLRLPNGVVRQYSLCGDRWDTHTYRVGVLREPDGRGGSAFVHDRLEVGDVVGFGGPRNNFALAPARRYLFVAGGIGITPLLPMVRQADLLGTDWHLLYGGRTRSSMAFTDELAAHRDRVTIVPQDECGLLDVAAHLPEPAADVKVYCCGPAPLLAAVERLCTGWPPGLLRSERFVPKVLPAPVRTAPFSVELKRSGPQVTVSNGQSVLDVVRAAGVPVLSSCRQGTCGTCETTVLAGEPDHRDSLTDDGERDRMFLCVSRALSDRLVLDL